MSLTEFPVEKSLDQCKWLFYAVILVFSFAQYMKYSAHFARKYDNKNFAVFRGCIFLRNMRFLFSFCFSIISEDGKSEYIALSAALGSVICRMTAGKYIKNFFVDNRFIYEDL